MADRSYPSWAAPPLGAVIGAAICARIAWREYGSVPIEWVLGGAVAGTAAGGILWLVDKPAPAAGVGPDSGPAALPESPIPAVVAVLCVPLSVIPVVGLMFAAGAVATTWRIRGWPRMAAYLAVLLSLVVTALFLLWSDKPPKQGGFPPVKSSSLLPPHVENAASGSNLQTYDL